jgi:hypothetical protein
VGQPVGHPFQLAIGEAAVAADQGDLFPAVGGLVLQEILD